MSQIFDIIGPNRALSIFGVKLVGFTDANGRKLLLTLGVLVVLWLAAKGSKRFARLFVRGRKDAAALFRSNQGINITTTALFLNSHPECISG
ncbi:MAG: hypothetical protein GF401_08950 [Chitinivibrionales bacterium]|nr:hypothetical protein [Chitinivibrionales bacterium]